MGGGTGDYSFLLSRGKARGNRRTTTLKRGDGEKPRRAGSDKASREKCSTSYHTSGSAGKIPNASRSGGSVWGQEASAEELKKQGKAGWRSLKIKIPGK